MIVNAGYIRRVNMSGFPFYPLWKDRKYHIDPNKTRFGQTALGKIFVLERKSMWTTLKLRGNLTHDVTSFHRRPQY